MSEGKANQNGEIVEKEREEPEIKKIKRK